MSKKSPKAKTNDVQWQQRSYAADKIVGDNVVESWLCVDCGTNTFPGSPSGPEIRIAQALGQVVTLHFDHDTELYHVKDTIWDRAGMRPWNGCLCVGCLEARLGRQLRPKDFARHDSENFAELPCTDRLLDRRGQARIMLMTDDGEREFIVPKQTAAMIERNRRAGFEPRAEIED